MLEERKGMISKIVTKTDVWVWYLLIAIIDALCLWGIFKILKAPADTLFHFMMGIMMGI